MKQLTKLFSVFVLVLMLASSAFAAAPSFVEPIMDNHVQAGTSISVPIFATDADGDVLTFTFTDSCSECEESTFADATFTTISTGISTDYGVVFEWSPIDSDVGAHEITVQVDDGTSVEEMSFILEVTPSAQAIEASRISGMFSHLEERTTELLEELESAISDEDIERILAELEFLIHEMQVLADETSTLVESEMLSEAAATEISEDIEEAISEIEAVIEEDSTGSEDDTTDDSGDDSEDDGSEGTTTYPPFVEIVTYDETMALGETQSITVYYEETIEYDAPVWASMLIQYESGDEVLYVFDESSLDAIEWDLGDWVDWELFFDLTPTQVGELTLTITITDESGDEDSDSVTITVTEEDDSTDDTTDDGSDDSADDSTDTTDSDGDGVIDSDDICEGFDDSIDTDGDGTPDGCDDVDDSESECDGSDAFCSFEEDIESLTSDFESYEEDFDDLEDDYDDARDDDDEEDLEDALDDLEGLKEDLEEMLEDIEDMRDDIDDADDDDDITSSEEDDLSDMLDDLEDDVEDLLDDVDDILGINDSDSVSADSWRTPTVVTSGSSSSDNDADDSTSTVDITRLNPTLPEDNQTSFEQSNSWEDMRYLAYLVAGIVVAFAALIFMVAVIATKKN